MVSFGIRWASTCSGIPRRETIFTSGRTASCRSGSLGLTEPLHPILRHHHPLAMELVGDQSIPELGIGSMNIDDQVQQVGVVPEGYNPPVSDRYCSSGTVPAAKWPPCWYAH